MNKWERLNKRFDEVLSSMTKEDWIKWDSERLIKNEKRKETLLNKSIIQAYKISSQWRENVSNFSVLEAGKNAPYNIQQCRYSILPPNDSFIKIKNDSVFPSHFFLV